MLYSIYQVNVLDFYNVNFENIFFTKRTENLQDLRKFSKLEE